MLAAPNNRIARVIKPHDRAILLEPFSVVPRVKATATDSPVAVTAAAAAAAFLTDATGMLSASVFCSVAGVS